MLKKKSRFPTKKEVVQAVSDDDALNGFEKYALIIEHKKLSNNVGMIKAELLQNNKILLRGKIAKFPERQQDSSFNWEMLKVGESYFEGYSLDFKGATFSQKIIDGFKKSITEGRIPYLSR